MKTIIAALALAVLPMPVHASNWVEMETDDNGRIAYIDVDSLKGSFSGTRSGWIKHDHSKQRDVAERSTMMKVSISCPANTFRVDYVVKYDAKGEVIGSHTTPTYEPFSEIIPDSVGETLAQIFCYDPGKV